MKALQAVHTAMLAGMVLFCVASATIYWQIRLSNAYNLNRILQVVVLAVSFICIKLGFSIFQRKLNAIPQAATPWQKIKLYQTAAIIKWALLELPVLFAATCFIITRNYAFIVLAFALTVLFALQGPVKTRVTLQLSLLPEEADELENGLK